MAKTFIETKSGTKIQIEGTAEEIAQILVLYNTPQIEKTVTRSYHKKKVSNNPPVIDKVRELLAEGFFKNPITLAELKNGLQEQGYRVPITALSGIVLNLTKARELRRIKENGKWSYVNYKPTSD